VQENFKIMKRIIFLDYLRIVAVAIVFAAHCLPKTFLEPLIFSGGAGVCIFFLISGYIIPIAMRNHKTMADFILNRVARIFPLFLIVVLMENLISKQIPNIFKLILPIGMLFDGHALVSGVDWTLQIEFLYYILIALIFFKLDFSVRNIFALQIISFALSIIFLDRALTYISYILIGSILQAEESKAKKYLPASIMISLASWMITQRYEFYNFFAISGLLIFFVMYFFRKSLSETVIIRFFADLTYPLYLTHWAMYKIFFKNTLSIEISMGLLVLCCFLLHFLIEKPAMNLTKKFS